MSILVILTKIFRQAFAILQKNILRRKLMLKKSFKQIVHFINLIYKCFSGTCVEKHMYVYKKMFSDYNVTYIFWKFSFRYRYLYTLDTIQHSVTSFISVKSSWSVLQGLVISEIPVVWTRIAWPETPSVGENSAGVGLDTASIHDSGHVIKVRDSNSWLGRRFTNHTL